MLVVIWNVSDMLKSLGDAGLSMTIVFNPHFRTDTTHSSESIFAFFCYLRVIFLAKDVIGLCHNHLLRFQM